LKVKHDSTYQTYRFLLRSIIFESNSIPDRNKLITILDKKYNKSLIQVYREKILKSITLDRLFLIPNELL